MWFWSGRPIGDHARTRHRSGFGATIGVALRLCVALALVTWVSVGPAGALHDPGHPFPDPPPPLVLDVDPLFPSSVTVGDTNLPASLSIINTTPGTVAVTATSITLNPSCGVPASGGCIVGDTGTLTLDTVGTGRAGTVCAGTLFTITGPDSAGNYTFSPTAPFFLDPPGSACIIDFTFDVVRAPVVDSQPANPGLQTDQIANVTASGIGGAALPTFGGGFGTSTTTVMVGTATMTPILTTAATSTPSMLGSISDTATLVAPDPLGPPLTGTVTFNLYSTFDATCTLAPIFTSTVPLVAGPPGGPNDATATSAPVTPGMSGNYFWIASYSGDANYTAVSGFCGEPGETSNVGFLIALPTTISTSATSVVALGSPITDTATVSPGPLSGSVTFNLYGPGDATCTAPPVFTASVPLNPVTLGTATSPPFTPTVAGAYRWVASFSGDPLFLPSTGACNDPNETSRVLGPPSIEVAKTAFPTTAPEPGGSFTFQVGVTNNSDGPVTITALVDDVYGNLDGQGTCLGVVGTVLAPGASIACEFTGPFTGNGGDSQTDVVTAQAQDELGRTVIDSDDATVTLTDVAPTITVDKTATPATRGEPGGTFTFDVVVTSTSSEAVTITALTDDIYGNVATQGTCNTAVGTVLAAAASYTCEFTGTFNGNAGDTQTDTVTAMAIDDEGTTATDTDDATVTLTDVAPTITVDKTATPATRGEPGGTFTFDVVVTNTSGEPVTITALTDDIYGNIANQGTCNTAVGTVLAAAATYSCAFTGTFTGNAGATQTDTVTATAADDEANTATDTDTATVTLTDVAPTVELTSAATPPSRPSPGGAFTFAVSVTNTSGEAVTITALTDDVYGNVGTRGTCTNAVGTAVAPGASYGCTFSADLTGAPRSQTDTLTVTVTDDDGTATTDTDTTTIAITATTTPPPTTTTTTAPQTTTTAPGVTPVTAAPLPPAPGDPGVAGTGATRTPQTTGTLPRTGDDTTDLLHLALALVGLGALLALAGPLTAPVGHHSRRRRR